MYHDFNDFINGGNIVFDWLTHWPLRWPGGCPSLTPSNQTMGLGRGHRVRPILLQKGDEI